MKLLKKFLAYFAMFEGIDHFVVSTISVIGLSAHHEYSFFAWFNPIWDYVMGAGTFFVGWVYRKNGQKDK